MACRYLAIARRIGAGMKNSRASQWPNELGKPVPERHFDGVKVAISPDPMGEKATKHTRACCHSPAMRFNPEYAVGFLLRPKSLRQQAFHWRSFRQNGISHSSSTKALLPLRFRPLQRTLPHNPGSTLRRFVDQGDPGPGKPLRLHLVSTGTYLSRQPEFLVPSANAPVLARSHRMGNPGRRKTSHGG